MTDPDVVAALERYISLDVQGASAMRRARNEIVALREERENMRAFIAGCRHAATQTRDEIVALRETVERQRSVLSQGHAEIRAEALERAAKLCEANAIDYVIAVKHDSWDEGCLSCASLIRELKGATDP